MIGPEAAVIATTGVRPCTGGDILSAVHGCIAGTFPEGDGITWTDVDRSRVEALLEPTEASGSWQPASIERRASMQAGSGGGM